MQFENLVLQTLLSDDCIMPKYGTEHSVGLDFALQDDVYIGAGSTVMVDLGFVVKFPAGVWGCLVPRSSTGKKGIRLANTIGVIDTDYQGPNDTLKVMLQNTTDTGIQLEKGNRIVQLILLPVIKPNQITVDMYDTVGEIDGESRGGFGSTGE